MIWNNIKVPEDFTELKNGRTMIRAMTNSQLLELEADLEQSHPDVLDWLQYAWQRSVYGARLSKSSYNPFPAKDILSFKELGDSLQALDLYREVFCETHKAENKRDGKKRGYVNYMPSWRIISFGSRARKDENFSTHISRYSILPRLFCR